MILPPLAFFIAALVLAVTPGPGIAYVVARTAAGGRAEGLASCIGTGLGGMLHVCAAAAVVGAAGLLASELSAGRRARLLSRISGVTLVGLGVYVAAARRGA